MKIKLLLSITLLIFITIAFFIYSNPILNKEDHEIVKQVLLETVPNPYKGIADSVKNNGVNIWYEIIRTVPSPTSTAVLISGAGMGAWLWPDEIINPLLDSGIQVIRFDHRGVGLSDWQSDLTNAEQYSLKEMSFDVLAILDELGIQKTHIIGASMGGMIGQMLAIHHPQRVLSLTSIMSSGFLDDPALPQLSSQFMVDAIKITLKYSLIPTESNKIKAQLAVFKLCRGNSQYLFDAKTFAQKILFEIKNRNGFNSKAFSQHSKAVSLSGSRYYQLHMIQSPTLIVHGKLDPVVNIKHSYKYAVKIPGSKTLYIDGMGHETPKQCTRLIMDRFFKLIQK